MFHKIWQFINDQVILFCILCLSLTYNRDENCKKNKLLRIFFCFSVFLIKINIKYHTGNTKMVMFFRIFSHFFLKRTVKVFSSDHLLYLIYLVQRIQTFAKICIRILQTISRKWVKQKMQKFRKYFSQKLFPQNLNLQQLIIKNKKISSA